MAYLLLVELAAIRDIQDAISYYDEQVTGLGKQIEEYLSQSFESIKKSPHFQLRYDEVHCLALRKFPFMVHYTISEKEQIVIIRAVFHTSLDPKKWSKR